MMEKTTKIVELFLNELASITIEMSPYILLGFLFAGILHSFIKAESFRKYFGKNNFRSVVNAALFGIPLPLCSCGVVPTGISLKNHGASSGATASFLVSTPQTGVDSILVSGSLIGWPFASIRVIVAFLSAIFTGAVTNIFNKKQAESNLEQKSINNNENKHFRKLFLKSINYAFIDLVQDIAKWLLIGLFLATLISMLVPDDFFTSYIGNQYLEMLLILLVSIPVYICATGSVPIAASLLIKGLSPGAALVLLMAGPVTNIASITILGNTLGKKNTVIYLLCIIVCAYLSGIAVNTFFDKSVLISSIKTSTLHHHMHTYSWFSLLCALFFSLMLLNALMKKYNFYSIFKVKANNNQINSEFMDKTVFKVEGMTCSHCKTNVEKNLMAIEGIQIAEADIVKNTVEVQGNAEINRVEEVINKLGYKFGGKMN